MPVVTLIGPRQSGKTTLVRHVLPNHRYLSLERPDIRQAALDDPLSFLDDLKQDDVILDEVQRVPNLLSYIQVELDERPRPGRFILTGSQNLLLMQGVSQSLAGRTSVLKLLPLSVAELLGRPLVGAADLLEQTPAPPPDQERWEMIWRGFYPRIHDQGLDPVRWLADYQRTYVERDLRDILRVMDLDGFERFVRLTAARTGTELNLADLAQDAGISQPTARSWLTALRVGSLVVLLQPHHQSFRKRLRKRPKLHFVDTGLVCYLLGIHSPGVLASHPLRGAIFETYVVAEMLKAMEHAGREPTLFHWRDATGHEIDLIVDLGASLIPLEVKAGRTVASDALDDLRWWTGLGGNPTRGGLLVHGGLQRQSRHGFVILPWYLG